MCYYYGNTVYRYFVPSNMAHGKHQRQLYTYQYFTEMIQRKVCKNLVLSLSIQHDLFIKFKHNLLL